MGWIFCFREQSLQRNVPGQRLVEEKHGKGRGRTQHILLLRDDGPMGHPGRKVSIRWFYESEVQEK